MTKSNDKFVDLKNSTDSSVTKDVIEGSNTKSLNFFVDQEIEVTPTGFKEYGVFCDCGDGFTGLLHISRITTNFVKNVSDYFIIGKPFKARIIEVHEKTKKLSLSTKEFNLEVK
ncbi:MAG: S1 RNA-binding domain-containing protein [Spiroplasma sp.]